MNRVTPLLLCWLFVPALKAQDGSRATPLDTAQARSTLAIRPDGAIRKSIVVRRSYERRPAKGLVVEPVSGNPTSPAGSIDSDAALIDVEVLHYEDKGTVERPYVPLPILFVVGDDTLLDETSRRNVDEMASILRDLSAADRGVRFEIQGHTSAEGDTAANQALSDSRASRILSLLLARGVEAKTLSTVGLGEEAAQHPETASEAERQLDRRVLIVRTR